MSAVTSLLMMVFPVAMAFSAANDLFTMKIPNRISLALIGGFLGVALLTWMPMETFGIHLACAVAVLAFTFALFAKNLLGGGDAKLMAAGALWMGSAHVIEYLAFVTIFGGVLCVVILGYRRVPAGLLPLPDWAQRLHTAGGPIPYGIAIAAGGLMVFPTTELFHAVMA
ncbi:MAG TPA: prepilin peptidase [Lacipirellulaceae bacterium]|jgi:prepilin peptidase CpaA|nr:prepilin peptidase [Lacipirellulaceae bacterium]